MATEKSSEILFTRFQIVDVMHHQKLIFLIIFSELLLGGKKLHMEFQNKSSDEPVKILIINKICSKSSHCPF